MKWFKKLLEELKSQKADLTTSSFTPRAQQALQLARKEADRLHHNYIGTEHVLLGLISLGQGVAVNVLGGLGLNLENVRTEVERLTGTGPEDNSAATAPYTPRVKKVLAYAREEAKALHHTYIGTEHLLLGLLRESDGIAAAILRNFNVDLEQVRMSVLKELDPHLIPENLVREPAKPPGQHVKIWNWPKRNFGEDFTPRAVQTLAFAREEAVRLHDNFIGTEHVLLGLLNMEKGVSANKLRGLGLNLENARQEVELRYGGGLDEKIVGPLPYTPRMKRVLEMARDEAKALKHTFIGTEHLLLGLLSEREGLAAEIFKKFGIDTEQLRMAILKELDPNFPSGNSAQKD